MPKLKLTQKLVEGLKGTEKLESYFDENLTGFGVYTKGKTKTYFVQARANGKLIKATIGKASVFSLDDARKEARTKLAQMSKGVNPNEEKKKNIAKGITLSSAIEQYTKAHQLKPGSVVLYEKLFRLYMSDWLNKPISSITKDMISQRHAAVSTSPRVQKVSKLVAKTDEELRADLETNPNKKPKMVKRVEVETPKPKNALANNLMRAFRSVYNFARAISDGAIPENPVVRLSETRQWYKEDRRRTIIKPHELKVWYEAVGSLKYQAAKDFMLVLLFCGFRREEAMKLRWSDIDFKEKTITVTDTKNGKPHTLPLSNYLYKLLEDRKNNFYENDFVFPGTGKKGYICAPVDAKNIIINATGIVFTFHDLRRTFITIAESLDIPYAALKRLLNHSMGTDVTDGYLSISTDRLRGPMEKISQRLVELMMADTYDNSIDGI